MKKVKDFKILLDEIYMKKFFRRHLKKFFPRAEKILYFSSHKINALSSKSFLVYYDLDLLYKNNFTKSEIVRGNHVNKTTYQLMGYLWREFLKKNQYAIPKPLYYFEKINFVLYKEFRGEILRDYAANKKILETTFPSVAKRLAQIHAFKPPKIDSFSIETEREFLENVYQKIKDFAPTFKKDYRQIIDQLLVLEKIIYQPQNFAINHNDFQASNIIYDKRSKNIGIIDFAFSDLYLPANDVGTFLSHLTVMVNPHFSQKETINLQKLFLKNYLKHLPQKLTRNVLEQLEIFRIRNALNILKVALSVFLYSTNQKRKLYGKNLTREILPLLEKDLKIAKIKTEKKLTVEKLLKKTSYWQLPKINVDYHY